MAVLVTANHALSRPKQDVDGRHKAGHDGERATCDQDQP